MAKVFIKTYGCTLNKVDSGRMEAELKARGHQIVEREEEADVIVVNTCTVKDATEKKELFYFKKLKASGKPFVIAGCLTVNEEMLKVFRVPMVSAQATSFIGDAVEDALSGRARFYSLKESKPARAYVFGLIAAVSIQEGCLNFCTFCQTKLARPMFFSIPPREIRQAVERALSEGAKEIDLTGMDTATYGRDLGLSLWELLRSLHRYKEGWFRLGMGNPQHLWPQAEQVIESLRRPFFTFLHVPVQSGSEKVLKDMNRGHTTKEFESTAKMFREKYGLEATLETDIIVGFPTEEEEDFEETLRLIERTRPNVVNVSKFSPRPGTKASRLPQLPREVVNERSRELSALVKEIVMEENEKLIGKEFEVISVEKGKARTHFYRQVVAPFLDLGETAWVEIEGITETSLVARKI